MQLVELPTFEATWWPLRMETIPGSGEAITVAVMVRAASGQSQVRLVIEPLTLSGVFGAETGKHVHTMLVATATALQKQLDGGTACAALEQPFGGFAFGHPRDCVAHDLNEVFDVAVRLCAAFGQSAFGRRLEVSDSSRKAFNDWADRVRTELLLHEGAMSFEGNDFNVPVKLARKQVRFGLVRSHYVANFGVLRPGSTSGDMRSLKVKVFDLESLRRDQVLPVAHTDVLVGCPQREALTAFTRREVDSYFTSLEFIENEARARHVDFVRCANPGEAAQHIRGRLRASR